MQNGLMEEEGASTSDGPPTPAEQQDPWLKALHQMEEENRLRSKIGLVLNERFKICAKVSNGSYGAIFAAVDTQTGAQVAVKFETTDKQVVTGKKASSSHLDYERQVYEVMQADGAVPVVGVPRMLWCGWQYEQKVLVMDLLGPSLEQLFTFCERQFTAATVFALGRQMVERVRAVHQCGFVHRDIKPENFLIGLADNESTLYLIDYGLARRYRFRDGDALKHIPFHKGTSLVGTARFASVNAHHGFELARRDDLESVAYIIIQLLFKDLPWKEERQRRRFPSKMHLYNRIKNMKERTSVREQLCAGWPEVADFLMYCRALRFEQQPDYDFLTGLLVKAARRVTGDERPPTQFDWARLMRDPHRRFSYECGFKWVLPIGQEPQLPPPLPQDVCFGYSKR